MSRGAPIKTVYAQNLRKNATVGERLLWEKLASRQLGAKFRRQHPLYGYIVDFYCTEFRLAVEVDGSSHDGRQLQDGRRDGHLAQHGIRTLRIADLVVRASPDMAAELVRDALFELGMPASRVDPDAAARRRVAQAIRHRKRREKQQRAA